MRPKAAAVGFSRSSLILCSFLQELFHQRIDVLFVIGLFQLEFAGDAPFAVEDEHGRRQVDL